MLSWITVYQVWIYIFKRVDENFQHLHPTFKSHKNTDYFRLIHIFKLHPCYHHIMCVQMCHMKFYFLAIVYHILFFSFVCCRALTNCVVFWIFKLRSWVYLPPTHPVITVCFMAVKEMATDPHKWSSTLFSECPAKQATVPVPMRTNQPVQKLEGF